MEDVPELETDLDKIVCEEMVHQFTEIIRQEKEKMTPELEKKIKKRYTINN